MGVFVKRPSKTGPHSGTFSNWRQLNPLARICFRTTAPAYCHHLRAPLGLSGRPAGRRYRLGDRADSELNASRSFCKLWYCFPEKSRSLCLKISIMPCI
jgi:hypothetical protein